MYRYYLGIGSNLDNKIQNIKDAIDLLKKENLHVIKIAPFYNNPALLLPNSPDEFNKYFCNTVIFISTQLNSKELLKMIKKIEKAMSRPDVYKKWSPRIIDIDILYCYESYSDDANLTIPHKEIFSRSFVLDPLAYLNSELIINNKSVLLESRKSKKHLPVIMGILNITDDSFSRDGLLNNNDKIEFKIKQWLDEAVPIIDIGAESTRPNARKITSQEEVERLEPIFKIIKPYINNYTTRFSIDTYHYDTAKIAIENGFSIINDVSGFEDERMFNLLRENIDIEVVLMHSLSIPVDADIVFDSNHDIILEMNKWSEIIINRCINNKIDLSRIIIDFGIGFGKNKFQSLEIIRKLKDLQNNKCRILIGHSRKSFMQIFSKKDSNERLIETLGTSASLAQSGVDIIRVHDPIEHKRFFNANLHCC